ncbi:spore morphogenesis/germination protein YwcE [Bacillus sp. GM2]|uniref:Spore morphogenesis and germination protein YwcE n=1 Tax=Bacillus paralicheniformis TaxID=1648923 RepID=A0A6I1M7R1_9BACI|nr:MULTISPECIES: spore morphogenesis/germination protein YwcE [Bacillus]ETB70342.1 spore germination protein [Bacillus sp. CPSM8]KUL14025.1 spore germination protein [Bacillus licheniformis LMG 7559]KUL18137.1 spore germination protein [Bacillus licheniformis LMG 6934]MBC8621770.1 spore morphogenesis/germination protein YwcE [Robertmurraya crescens]NVB34911.1 spore morphogenesis/germination protein YwcE [Bacillus licheniformis]POO81652.1 spore gernimation protein [Bacillus sp. MBGLi97]
MDMFFAYLLIASATPLFLWLDNKKVAISSIPPIILMWVFFFFYMTSSLSPTGHSLMIVLFILNVVIAHVAAFIIYGLPLIRKHMSR